MNRPPCLRRCRCRRGRRRPRRCAPSSSSSSCPVVSSSPCGSCLVASLSSLSSRSFLLGARLAAWPLGGVVVVPSPPPRLLFCSSPCSIRFRRRGAPKARYRLCAISAGCLRTLFCVFNTQKNPHQRMPRQNQRTRVIGTQPMRRICATFVLFRSVCCSLRCSTRRLAHHFSSWHSYSKRPIQLFGDGSSSGLQHTTGRSEQ